MRFTFPQFRSSFTIALGVFSLPILLFVSFATADETRSSDLATDQKLADVELRALLEAKSPRELKTARERGERIKLKRIECDIQLKGKRVPDKCFEVMSDEFEAGLIAPDAQKLQENWLADLCKKRAQASGDLLEMNRLSHSQKIPATCLEQIAARALDLKYASESEDPSALFTDRFRLVLTNNERVSPKSGQAAQKLHNEVLTN